MEGRPEGEAGTVPVPVGPEQLDGGPEAVDAGASAEAAEVDWAAVVDRFDARLAESQRLHSRQAELTEKLHTENQALRAGELRSAQTPLVRGLIRLCDDLERLRAVAEGSAEDLSMVHESLLDLLARSGVEAIAAERGEPFDSRLHSASGVEPTEDEQLDRTVAEVERTGFRWESGDVIRVAEVRAYRFTSPT